MYVGSETENEKDLVATLLSKRKSEEKKYNRLILGISLIVIAAVTFIKMLTGENTLALADVMKPDGLIFAATFKWRLISCLGFRYNVSRFRNSPFR